MVTRTGNGGAMAGAGREGRNRRDPGTRRVAKSRPKAAATMTAVSRGACMPLFVAGFGHLAKGKRIEIGVGRAIVAKMQAGTTTTPEVVPGQETDLSEAFAKGWRVVVWNDPVNLMSYVVFVFMRVLGFNETKAKQCMLEVHEQGKSVVAVETREKAEFYCHRLQEFGLKSTLEATA